MGFREVFENPDAGKPSGGGVTPGKEPWLAGTSTTTTVRTAKPFILYTALDEDAAKVFLAAMSDILARNQGRDDYVADDGTGIVHDPGTGKWIPVFSRIVGLDRVSLAVEDAGIDPTQMAIQAYRNPSEVVIAVRAVSIREGVTYTYEGRHNLALVLGSPYVFATEVRIGVGLPPQHKPDQA